ncbi:MAG: hypothetical protein ABI954_10105 [Pyrinomonadaceae bacterium]
MCLKKISLVLLILLWSVCANAQAAAPEVTITLNEQFLNSFLEAVFTNLDTPKFQLSKVQSPKSKVRNVKVSDKIQNPKSKTQNRECDESITLLRETGGVKTAIHFVNGQIIASLAFTGTYDIPFVGCSNFKGVAEANLNLEYDRAKQILFGRVKVSKVDLKGVPSLASGVVARFVQGSIDSRVNPLEILKAEQVSAIVPVKYANGSIKLRAVDMKHEIIADALNVRVTFEFTKAQ